MLKRRRRSLHFLRRGFRGTHECCISRASGIIACKFPVRIVARLRANVDIFGGGGARVCEVDFCKFYKREGVRTVLFRNSMI